MKRKFMKRFKAIFAIIFILVVVSSCKGVSIIDDETTDDKTSDETTAAVDDDEHKFDWQYSDLDNSYGSIGGDYIFRMAIIPSTVLKYNVNTGECTSLCPDPFCKHEDESCPIYLTLYVVGIGNTAYGVRIDETAGYQQIYSYNVDTGKMNEVYKLSGRIIDFYAYEKYLYVHDNSGYFRLNTETGEKEPINRQYNASIYVIRGHKIIWGVNSKDLLPTEFIATDLTGNDPRPYNFQIFGGYLHITEPVEYSLAANIHLLDRDGNTVKTVVKRGRYPSIRDDCIMYYGMTDDPWGKGNPLYPEVGKGSNPCTGDIFIVPFDTWEPKLLCHIENGYFGLTGFPQNPCVCGDWVGIATVDTYERSKSLNSDSDSNLVLVNLKTGEYHISRYIE